MATIIAYVVSIAESVLSGAILWIKVLQCVPVPYNPLLLSFTFLVTGVSVTEFSILILGYIKDTFVQSVLSTAILISISVCAVVWSDWNVENAIVDDVTTWVFNGPLLVTILLMILRQNIEFNVILSVSASFGTGVVLLAYNKANKNPEQTKINREKWNTNNLQKQSWQIDTFVIWAVEYDINKKTRPGLKLVALQTNFAITILLCIIVIVISITNATKYSTYDAIKGTVLLAVSSLILFLVCAFRWHCWSKNNKPWTQTASFLEFAAYAGKLDEETLHELEKRTNDISIGTGIGDAGLPHITEMQPVVSVEQNIGTAYGSKIAGMLKENNQHLSATISAGNFNKATENLYVRTLMAMTADIEQSSAIFGKRLLRMFEKKDNKQNKQIAYDIRYARYEQAKEALDGLLGVWPMEEFVVQMVCGFPKHLSLELAEKAQKITNKLNSFSNIQDIDVKPATAQQAVVKTKQLAQKALEVGQYGGGNLIKIGKSMENVVKSLTKSISARHIAHEIIHEFAQNTNQKPEVPPEEHIIRVSLMTAAIIKLIIKLGIITCGTQTFSSLADEDMVIDLENGGCNNAFATLIGANDNLSAWFDSIQKMYEIFVLPANAPSSSNV